MAVILSKDRRKKGEKILKSWACHEHINEINRIKILNTELKGLKALKEERKLAQLKGESVSDHVEKIALKIAQVEEEINFLEKRLSLLKHEKELVDNFMTSLDSTEYDLIVYRYKKRKNWQAVSMGIYLSIRQCFRKHNKIINDLLKYMEENDFQGRQST